MAVALPAFLNQANKAKASTVDLQTEFDSLTGMRGTLTGATDATSGRPLKSYVGITFWKGGDFSTQTSRRGNGGNLTIQLSVAGLGLQDSTAQTASLGSLNVTPTAQGSRPQAEGVMAWSIGFADVVRPSSSTPGVITPADGIIRGTFLF